MPTTTGKLFTRSLRTHHRARTKNLRIRAGHPATFVQLLPNKFEARPGTSAVAGLRVRLVLVVAVALGRSAAHGGSVEGRRVRCVAPGGNSPASQRPGVAPVGRPAQAASAQGTPTRPSRVCIRSLARPQFCWVSAFPPPPAFVSWTCQRSH